METDKSTAVGILKYNRGSEQEIGILQGKDLETVMKVHGEYAPYCKVHRVEDLFE